VKGSKKRRAEKYHTIKRFDRDRLMDKGNRPQPKAVNSFGYRREPENDGIPCPCGSVALPTERKGWREYECTDCTRGVRCHEGSWEPQGIPATPRVRWLRRQVHLHLDPLWRVDCQGRDRALMPRQRTAIYDWLARQVGARKGLEPGDRYS
jgi:hypothetical protein